MTELAEIKNTLEVILRQLAALKPQRKPLTQTEFAKAAGYSRRSIYQKVQAGEIRVVDGRIPASELDRFLS